MPRQVLVQAQGLRPQDRLVTVGDLDLTGSPALVLAVTHSAGQVLCRWTRDGGRTRVTRLEKVALCTVLRPGGAP